MSNFAQARKNLRPHGILAASCPGCVFFDRCGGIEPEQALFNCFDLHCCDKGNCDNVCPHKPDFMDRVPDIRQALARPLHLLAIGGAQFVEYLAARLGDFSLIDSTPFMKAMKRQCFDPTRDKRQWKKVRTEKGQALDPLTAHNLTHYADWIDRRRRHRTGWPPAAPGKASQPLASRNLPSLKRHREAGTMRR